MEWRHVGQLWFGDEESHFSMQALPKMWEHGRMQAVSWLSLLRLVEEISS